MRCPKCGNENPDDAIFCTSCGQKIAEEENCKICSNCGSKNYIDSVFCTVCGKMLDDEDVSKNVVVVDTPKKEKMSPLNIATLVISIVGASFTLIDVNEILALIGITISLVAVVILAIGLITKKIKGSIKFSLSLGIYGIIGNMAWLVFLMWMLPNF